MSTILEQVKDWLMIDKEESAFDDELLMHISSAIATLNQNGVGNYVEMKTTSTWNDFIDQGLLDDPKRLGHAKHYVFLKTKLIFDPPPAASAGYLDSNANEMLWRAREG